MCAYICKYKNKIKAGEKVLRFFGHDTSKVLTVACGVCVHPPTLHRTYFTCGQGVKDRALHLLPYSFGLNVALRLHSPVIFLQLKPLK